MYIKCNSHRSRDKSERIIGRMQGWFSLAYDHERRRYVRGSPTGGIFLITDEQYELIKDITGVTKLRGPFDDLMQCRPL